MHDIAQDVSVYDVAVNPETLALMELEKGGTGCSVQLRGSFDQRWADAFARQRRESRVLSRFELEPSTGIVRFVREPGTDPADVMEALEVLEAFVERVSRQASGQPR